MSEILKTEHFHYTLPPDLIAKYPLENRTSSRLLVLDGETGALQHLQFSDIARFLNPGDLLVFNDTRVIPARLFGCKESGGRVEVLIERILPDNQVLAHVRASKSPKVGSQLMLEKQIQATVIDRENDLFILHFDSATSVLELLEQYGHVPLPPYINRDDESIDFNRYQTVYARNQGAVAAPTAGLHFDDDLLQAIKSNGVETAFITLHVGAGTFQPVRVENIKEHKMHSEIIDVPQSVCDQITACRLRGNKVIAVGTTTVRSLETAAQSGEIKPFKGDTDIFIYPGYAFKVIDALITNFHLPESTLLMLVSAFASRDQIIHAYQAAIQEKYRFFSYGDAMFIKSPKNSELTEN